MIHFYELSEIVVKGGGILVSLQVFSALINTLLLIVGYLYIAIKPFDEAFNAFLEARSLRGEA